MNTFKYLMFSIFLLNLVACNGPAKEEDTDEEEVDVYGEENVFIPADLPQLVKDLVQKHNVEEFYEKDVFAFEIQLTFNGEQRLNATVFSRTNSTRIKVEKADGTVILYDGEAVVVAPDTVNFDRAQFDALTWAYFAMAPFKFIEAGTEWGAVERMALREKGDTLRSIKLSFENGVGFTPDDWYQLFVNEETGLLEAMGYIVTSNDTSQEEAEKNPHAIVYSDYQPVQGAILAGKWKFHNWNKEDGLGEQIGEATITNLRFVEETEDLFVLSTGTERIPAGG